MRLLAICLLIFSVQKTSAGIDKVGNGGHLVVCDNNLWKDYFLLDYFEAKHFFHFRPSLSIGNDYDEALWQYSSKRISIAALRMLEVVPSNHEIMSIFSRAQNFVKNADFEFHEDIENIETRDTGKVWAKIPRRCKLTQVAIRKIVDGEDRIIINKDVYKDMGKSNYIGLMIHEALHDYFGSQTTTLAVRQVIWWLSAPRKFRSANAALIRDVIDNKSPVDIRLFKKMEADIH